MVTWRSLGKQIVQGGAAQTALRENESLHIRLGDPSLMPELIEFLERCQCDVHDVDARTVAVAVDPAVGFASAMRLVKAGLCYSCGGEIGDPLIRLGSTTCHDCRDSGARWPDDPRRGASVKRRREWTRMKLEAYLKVWGAQHPGSGAEVVG